MAIQAIKLTRHQSHRHQQTAERGRDEFAGQLRKFHPGRAAIRTTDRVIEDALGSMRLSKKLRSPLIVGPDDCQVNRCQGLGNEPKALEFGIIVDEGFDAGLLEAHPQLLSRFHLMKSRQ